MTVQNVSGGGMSKKDINSLIQSCGQMPNGMRKFYVRQISDTSVGIKFLEPKDSYDSEGNLLCKVAGVMIRRSQTDYPQSISDGELVINNTNLGAYDSNELIVTVPSGTNYFTAFPYTTQGVYNTNGAQSKSATHIYGIKFPYASSNTITRTDEAVGLTAQSAIVGTRDYASDFDDLYPWCEMRQEVLSTGDVMVWIPEFYYQRVRSGNDEIWRISNTEVSGFAKHPGSGKWISKHRTSSNNRSVPNAGLTALQTRATMRANAKAKGAGWQIYDEMVHSALTFLYLIEYANWDSQTALGRGYCDGNSATLATGSCYGIVSGRPAGTDGKTGMVYRGVEDFFSNQWIWSDGINMLGADYYICLDPDNYADDTSTNYVKLSYSGSTSWSQSYITELGLDEDYPWALLPSAAGSGSATTFMCDAAWSAAGNTVCGRGGDWGAASGCGVSAVALGSSSSDAPSNFGSRLVFDPSKA